MMKKRISILIFTILFLVSTTGLPVSYHLCKMMENKSVNECGMCNSQLEEMKPSCCSEETNEYQLTISSDNPSCCQTEFVYNKIEDEFVINKTDVNLFSSFENVLQPVVLNSPSIDFYSIVIFYCDSSPPFLINPELYISNSILLI